MKYSVKNLRGTAEIAVDLRPLSLVLGKNGSGKTTLLKSLSLGAEVARSLLSNRNGLRLDSAWIRKFDVYSVTELMSLTNEDKSMTWSWQVDQLEYRFTVERVSNRVERFTMFEVVYPGASSPLYSVSLKGRELAIECSTEYVDLLYFLEEGVISKVDFSLKAVCSERDVDESRLAKAHDAMLSIVGGEFTTLTQSMPSFSAEIHPEEGLMLMFLHNGDFKNLCQVERPSEIYRLMSMMSPSSSVRIPRVKYFKMSNRTHTLRYVEPSDELWAPLIEKFGVGHFRCNVPWKSIAAKSFVQYACPLFDLDPKISLRKTEANNVMISVGDLQLYQLGTGHRQIIRLIVELALVIDQHQGLRHGKGSQRMARRSRTNQIFVIEEPEVSLHPDAQAKIFQLVLNAKDRMKDVGVNASFIIETHSEYLVRMAQLQVKEKKLNASEVNMLFMGGVDGDLDASIVNVNKDGFLSENLPSGFLDETSRIIDRLHFS